jgi:hypothetical protein
VSRVKRKTFVAREDLIDRLSEIAKRRGYSLFAMVNEIFELAIKAEEMGVNLREIIEGRNILRAAREAGFILGPESLWYEMANISYEKVRNQVLKSWFEAGVWLAKRYASSRVDDSFTAFKRDLEAFTWNIPEFTMERLGGKVSVRIISPRFTEPYTILFASFLEGALSAFGYRTTYKEIFTGNIRLEASREEAYAPT